MLRVAKLFHTAQKFLFCIQFYNLEPMSSNSEQNLNSWDEFLSSIYSNSQFLWRVTSNQAVHCSFPSGKTTVHKLNESLNAHFVWYAKHTTQNEPYSIPSENRYIPRLRSFEELEGTVSIYVNK